MTSGGITVEIGFESTKLEPYIVNNKQVGFVNTDGIVIKPRIVFEFNAEGPGASYDMTYRETEAVGISYDYRDIVFDND